MEQIKSKNKRMLIRGRLTPEQDAQVLLVIAESAPLTIAGQLTVTLSTNSLAQVSSPCGRADAANTLLMLGHGPAVQYGLCDTHEHEGEKFLVESAIAFPIRPSADWPVQQGCGRAQVTPERFQELLKEGQTIGAKLLPLHSTLATALFAARGRDYRDPERYLWMDLSADVLLDEESKPILDKVRLRLDFNPQSAYWSETPISLVGEPDIEELRREILASG